MFDTDFGAEATSPAKAAVEAEKAPLIDETDVPAEPEFVEEIVPTFSEQEMNSARADGQRAGREEALAEMAASLEQQTANALNTINIQVENLFEAYAKDIEDHGRNAIAIATVIMRKLFPALNIEHSMVEVENLIDEAMQRTSGAPSLLIKVPANLHAVIEAKVIEMAALRGREGRITVTADEDMPIGDLQVKWDGGGILRDTTLLWSQIDEIIERNLGASAADITQKPAAPEQDINQDQAAAAASPEQEVVKQGDVSENKEILAESPAQGDTIEDVPVENGPQLDNQASDKEPEG